MRTLYLHIGTPKTATSSIQKFLYLNQEVLKSHNYSYRISPVPYPNIGKNRNAHFLCGPEPNESLTEESRNQFQEHLTSGLNFIKDQFAVCDNVILTDEHLWFSMNYSQWDPLKILVQHAEENNYKIRIIVYLRRQDQFLVSNWNQKIKKGISQKPIDKEKDFLLEKNPLILHYASALDKLSERIGKDNVIVRRFEPSYWLGGNICDDFLDAVGLSAEALSLNYPDEKVNRRITNNYAGILATVNQSHILTEEEKNLLRRITWKVSDKRGEHEEYGILTAEETSQFLSLFEKENARIAEEYIGDGNPMFSEKIKEVKKWSMDNPYMEEDFGFLLAEISDTLIEKQREIKSYEKNLTSVRFCMRQTLICLRNKFFH